MWIIKNGEMYLSHLFDVDGHEPVSDFSDVPQRLAIRFPSRSAAVDTIRVMRARQGVRLRLVRLHRKAVDTTRIAAVSVRKEREDLGTWLMANLRGGGIFVGPQTNADTVKLMSKKDFVVFVLSGGHILERVAPSEGADGGDRG